MPSAAIVKAYKLASQYHAAGQLHAAEGLYRQILQHDPNHPAATHHLGIIAHQSGDSDAALQLIARSIALAPSEAYFYKNLAEVLRARGDFVRAADAYHHATQLAPADATAHHGLGLCLDKLDRIDEAVAAYQHAVALDPRNATAQFNLGVALEKKGLHDEALAAFDRTLDLRPDYPLARASRATSLLRKGNFTAGWLEYESRFDLPDFAAHKPQTVDPEHPLWTGSDPDGRTILVRAEQGLGDTIHFARYVPLLIEQGADVVFEVQPPLVELMKTLDGDPTVIAMGDALPRYDVHAPLMSLPRLFKTSIDSIPSNTPYLAPDPDRRHHWRERLRADGNLKVGLVWSGSPNPMARHRACALSDFAPLAAVQGVTFYSLQKGEPAAQLQSPPEGLSIVDLGPELRDWQDTASVLSLLDLLISVDTAVPQLSGALGRPTWLLLPTLADFRWLLNRDDTPWYPRMRLFRQTERGNWKPVIDRVAAELAERVDSLKRMREAQASAKLQATPAQAIPSPGIPEEGQGEGRASDEQTPPDAPTPEPRTLTPEPSPTTSQDENGITQGLPQSTPSEDIP